MQKKTCFFIGHREAPDSILPTLIDEVERHITEYMGVSNHLPCNIEDVVDLLSIPVVRSSGTQLHCRCPFCDDRKAHLNINLSKNVFRCNRCGTGGGVLHLYAEVNNISINTAYEELCRIFQSGEKAPEHPVRKAQTKVKQSKPALELASVEARDNTYSNLLSMLSLGTAHREALLGRGLSGSEIIRLGYKTTPAVRSAKIVTELLERGCDLKGVPGFYVDEETGQWKLDIRATGIMVPDRNCEGQIEAIQIRLDKDTHSKFNTLTSVDKYYGATASCCPHFAGVTGEDDAVYLTEGVMKADIARYFSTVLGHPCAFVGLTGVSNINQYVRMLEELKRFGINTIKVAFDMDLHVNENVRKARDRVIQVGCENGFEVIPKRWSSNYKGIDDLLLSFIERRRITDSIFGRL